MKRSFLLISFVFALFTAVPSFAWHCPTGQHWVQVANGTPGATIVEGIPFTCQPDTPTPVTPKDPSSSASSSSNAAASSNSTAAAVSSTSSTQNQSQKQSQGQSQTANGGNANNSNANNGNSLSTAYNSTYNQVRQAPMAYAPEVFSTAACRVGASAGVSAPIGGISLGGSKKDKDCERSILASQFIARGNLVAGCKLLMHVGVVKEALSFDECMIAVQPKPVVIEAPVAPVTPSITVNVPAPVIVPQPVQIVAEKPQVVTVTARKTIKHTARKTNPCPITVSNGVKTIHERGEK